MTLVALVAVGAPVALMATPAEAVAVSPSKEGPLTFIAHGGTSAKPYALVHVHSPRSNADHYSRLPFSFGSYATTATYVSMSVQRKYGSTPIYRGRVTCTIKLNGVRVVHRVGYLGHVTCRALVGRR